MLQVLVQSKLNGRMNVKVLLECDGDDVNVQLPVTPVKHTVYGNDWKAMAHFHKVDPEKPWGGQFNIQVQASGQAVRNQTKYSDSTGVSASPSSSAPLRHMPLRHTGGGSTGAQFRITPSVSSGAAGADLATVSEGSKVMCDYCNNINDYGMDFCEKCGESLESAPVLV